MSDQTYIQVRIKDLKNILKSKSIIYDFLVEKKGYYLDPCNSKYISNEYLDKLFRG